MTKPTGRPHATHKTDLCLRALIENPALAAMSARGLEARIQINGKSISFKTWSRAKQKLSQTAVRVTFQPEQVVVTKGQQTVKLVGLPDAWRNRIHKWAVRRGYIAVRGG